MYLTKTGTEGIKREKIALVVHRYGKEINGGAEDHCKLLAEHLINFYSIDVLTSCSKTPGPWNNEYQAGKKVFDGINVFRFKVEDISKYSAGSIERRGPFCPEFQNFLAEHHDEYKAIIFITYSHYLSYIGLMQDYNNTIFLPTAHNEEWLRNEIYQDVFHKARGFLFNTIEERLLIEKTFNISDKCSSRTGCFGIEISDYELPDDQYEQIDPYIIYAGRVCKGKNFDELNEFFLRYKLNNQSNLKLVVIGMIENGTVITHHDDIIFKGYVSEDEKKHLIKNSMLMVIPSVMESLSIVLLESLAMKRPVLVNGLCDVLRGQCERSNAGLYYSNYYEFETELNYLIGHEQLREEMGKSGYNFVKENYAWEKVVDNVVSLIDEVNKKERKKEDTKKVFSDLNGTIDIKKIVTKLKKEIKKHINDQDLFLNRLIDSISNYEEIVIVGAGKYGRSLYKVLRDENVTQTIYLSDNKFERYQKSDEMMRVYAVEDAVQRYPNAYFIVTPKYYILDLVKQLIDLEVPFDQIGYYIV